MHVHAYDIILLLFLLPCVSAARVRLASDKDSNEEIFVPGVLQKEARFTAHSHGDQMAGPITGPLPDLLTINKWPASYVAHGNQAIDYELLKQTLELQQDGSEWKDTMEAKEARRMALQFPAYRKQDDVWTVQDLDGPAGPVTRMLAAPLLTFEQEIILGKLSLQVHSFEKTREALAVTLHREPRIEEWAGAAGYDDFAQFKLDLEQGRHAKAQLVKSNMRLVMSIARRYQPLGLRMEDLIQEGTLGLMRACEDYDPSRGFRFATYASWWVRGFVFRAVGEQERLIRLPQTVLKELELMRKTSRDMVNELGGRAPTDAELAARVGLPIGKLRKRVDQSRRTLSVTHQYYDKTLQSEVLLPEDHVEEMELLSSVNGLLMDVLDDQELFVMVHSFGLQQLQKLKMREIAEVMDLGQTAVKTIKNRAIRKLRQPQNQMRLRPLTYDKRMQLMDEAAGNSAVDHISDIMAARGFQMSPGPSLQIGRPSLKQKQHLADVDEPTDADLQELQSRADISAKAQQTRGVSVDARVPELRDASS